MPRFVPPSTLFKGLKSFQLSVRLLHAVCQTCCLAEAEILSLMEMWEPVIEELKKGKPTMKVYLEAYYKGSEVWNSEMNGLLEE
jgi:hypothetical protein